MSSTIRAAASAVLRTRITWDPVVPLYFFLCLTLGRLLRSSRYSKVSISWTVDPESEHLVRKQRLVYAPLLIWMGGPLARILDLGVRILPQREWEKRERMLYKTLYGSSIGINRDGALVLPRLPGATLASLLADPKLDESDQKRAISGAVVALTAFHRRGFTHGDAMAENVVVDLETGLARWFDFETRHDLCRTPLWRRADDVRALLATCVARTSPERSASTVQLILDTYANEEVTDLLTTSFTTKLRRPLLFHLAQAGLSLRSYQEIAQLLRKRLRS